SISGSSSFANLVVDQSGTGDLFTASKSGATKFVIKNNGNVGIGNANPASTLDISGTFNVTGNAAVGTLNGNTITTGTGTLTLGAGKTLTANDTTTFDTNQITLGGTETIALTAGKNVAFADAFTTAGANPLTLTTTGSTNVTLPTTGTLATLIGTETFQNKTLDNTNNIT